MYRSGPIFLLLAALAIPAIPASAAEQVPAPAAAPAAAEPLAPPRYTFSGLLQAWYASGDQQIDSFRIRRAELKMVVEVTPKAKATVMIDPSKALSVNNTFVTLDGRRVVLDSSVNQASRVLQDAFLTLNYIDGVQIDVGQLKVPLSYEGLMSSARLDTVERTLFATDRLRGGSLADVRDVGIVARGKLGAHFDWNVGLFNGSGEGQNDVDKNEAKAVAARLVLRVPGVAGLQFGASAADGETAGPGEPRRDRLGADVHWAHGPWTARAELMTGKDGALERRGGYAHLGYRIDPRFEVVARADSFDPDTARDSTVESVRERDLIAGVNVLLADHRVKAQVEYLRKEFAGDRVPARNVVLVNLQTSW
jgi:hypothetical protein